MKYKYLFLLILCIPLTSLGQKPDSLLKKLDSLDKKVDSTGTQKNNISLGAYNETTKITSSTYFVLLWSNYKQQFSAPLHIGSKGWGTIGKFAVLTGGLAFADKPIQKQAIKFKSTSQTAASISSFITNTGGQYEMITLGAIGAYGFIFKDEKMKTTTFLASQAYLTSAGVSYVIKFLSGRQRPSVFSENRVTANPTFKGPFANLGRDENGKKLNSSFPSGHTTVAFAAATVYAMEYRIKPWVPIVSYSAASLIGLSRLTENKQWATDVLVGSALGYLSGRQVVNNYHRYAKVKREDAGKTEIQKKKGGRVSFILTPVHGYMLAGLRYLP